ncbi:cupin [Actinacidiphila sp. ITFR-21]|uniref:cupin n=1 Tax=Actinacidiphila sp. ITFR-21 TaxID=3075199 RepID=UPI002889487C|nr:cupin [Streptomyces sp. ITFR-21]WNI20272.1 cupin [Streptomyces sp. ITFR-21]
MPSAGLRSRVEAIPGRPLPHGILGGCADIIDVTDEQIHELMGVEWMSLGCCPVRDTDWCADESPGEESPGLPGSSPPKEFCSPETEHASPHTIYAGAKCSTMGWSYAEAVEQVRATLELGEQRAIEAAFWRDNLAANALDLTPAGGPVNIAAGVAALEGCLAETYGGIGVLHVPAGAAALLGCCNILSLAGGTPQTLTGNCAIIGAGYSYENSGPGGIPADPGTAWLYISGPVVVRRGPVDIIPDRAGPSIDTRFNDQRVLAERTVVVGTTCSICAINVELCP